MIRNTYINLPVKDLNETREFFSQVGFDFDEDFSGEECVCMVIADGSFAMLVVESFFRQFTKKEIADASKTTEVVTALSADSRDEVDEMMSRALNAGGAEPIPVVNQGWMYCRTFEDPNGHIWEVFHMSQGDE